MVRNVTDEYEVLTETQQHQYMDSSVSVVKGLVSRSEHKSLSRSSFLDDHRGYIS